MDRYKEEKKAEKLKNETWEMDGKLKRRMRRRR